MKKQYRQKKSLREIETKKKYNGEASPYWDFMNKVSNKRTNGDGLPEEDSIANPDVLSEDDHIYHRPLTEEGELQFQAVRETVSELSPQQQRVLQLCGFDGLTMREAAKELGISIPTVQDYLQTAREKIKAKYFRMKTEADKESK